MLRSIFITVYFLFTIAGWVLSLIHVTSMGGHPGWFANTVVFSGLMFWWLYLRYGKLTNASFGGIVLTAALGAGALISVGYHRIVDPVSPFSFQLPIIGFFGWMLYHMWYCKVPKTKGLPEVATSSAQKFVLKMAHRGAWCGYSRYQIDQFKAKEDQLKEAGIDVQWVTHDMDALKKKLPGLNIVEPGSAGFASYSRSQVSPVGLSVFGFDSKGFSPFAILENENGDVIAVHTPKDLRNLPGPDYFLRYARSGN